MANSIDPDQMPHSVVSDQGLHCLQRHICPNTWVYYSQSNEYTSLDRKDDTLTLLLKSEYMYLYLDKHICFLGLLVA